MTRMLTSLAAASVLALASTGAFAACFDGHASLKMSKVADEETVMSTFDGDPKTLTAEEDAAAVVPAPCAEGDPSCETQPAE